MKKECFPYSLSEVKMRYDTKYWNKCDICGRFISMNDFSNGKAIRRMITPDSDYSNESYETLCYKHLVN